VGVWLSIFSIPSFDEPGKNRAAAVLGGILWLFLGLSASFSISLLFFFDSPNFAQLSASTAAFAIILIILLVLTYRGMVELASWSLLFVLLLLFFALGIHYGFSSTILGHFCVWIVLSAVLIGEKSVPYTTVISGCTILLVYFFEFYGWYPPEQLSAGLILSTQLLQLMFFGFVMYWSSRSSRRNFEELTKKREELTQANLALRVSEKDVMELIQESPEGIISCDDQGVIRWFNPKAERLSGYNFYEMVGKNMHDMEFFAEPEALLQVESSLVSQDTGTFFAQEVNILRKDGKMRPVEVNQRFFRRADGSSRMQMTLRDVSERRETERIRRQLEEQLLHAQKLESIGRLVGGIAHDFNNLLSVIISHCSLLLYDEELTDSANSDIQEISKAADRAAKLTRQLLAFGRKQILKPIHLDVNAAIRKIRKMNRRMLGEHILYREDLAGASCVVEVDAGQFDQVLVNLVLNAREAMQNGGKLIIQTRKVELKENDRERPATLEPGIYVRICVKDTGIGMDDSILKRVFEPFFTTRQEGSGTGLGLAVVHGIIKQSGGHITVESRVKKGTIFKIFLPWIEVSGTFDLRGIKAEQAELPTGRAVILLIEDEEAVRFAAAKILKRLGYQIHPTSGTKEAMEIFQKHGKQIDLILSDVVMPEDNGPVLVEKLQKAGYQNKVVFMSGYVDHEVLHSNLLRKYPFLQKPFSPQLLAETVNQALTGQNASKRK